MDKGANHQAQIARTAIVVPTYRRPEDLRRCLAAIAVQESPPGEIVVVRREEDHEAAEVAAAFDRLPLVVATVAAPGVLAAMARGVAATSADVVCFLDDDTEPAPDWLARALGHFDDPAVGAVGGRDVIEAPVQDGPLTSDVGRVTSWGRLIGNHHLGTGDPRDVDVLKGANMAFRRAALALPDGLRGAGAQAHYEVATCLWARGRGWRVVFDPAMEVRHAASKRFDADRRDRPQPSAVRDASENLVLCMLSFRPALTRRRALYGLLVGDGRTPGLVRAAVALCRRETDLLKRVVPSMRGQARALRALAAGYRVPMVTFERSPEGVLSDTREPMIS